MLEILNKLPVFSRRSEILEQVSKSDFLVLSASTGSGKSTMVPVFLSSEYDLVFCTQTRRAAAKSLFFSLKKLIPTAPVDIIEELVGMNESYV